MLEEFTIRLLTELQTCMLAIEPTYFDDLFPESIHYLSGIKITVKSRYISAN